MVTAIISIVRNKWSAKTQVEPELEGAERHADVVNLSRIPADKLFALGRGTLKLQRAFRKTLHRDRLHLRNLSDRILFENGLMKGLCRLVVQLCIFALVVSSCYLTSDSGLSASRKAGLLKELVSALDLDSLADMKDRREFDDTFFQVLSSRSKLFFPLGSSYFKAGTRGRVELLRAREAFTAPVVLDGIDLNVQLREFSFTAWVKISEQFNSGYVIRKRVGKAVGEEHLLTCWGWYLSAEKGQEFHFGAHDFSPFASPFATANVTSPHDSQIIGRFHRVATKKRLPIAADTDVLLTMRILQNNTSTPEGIAGWVSFFVNDLQVAEEPLLRQVTDCYNGLEGPLLGTTNLELAQVRFYPFAMRTEDIRQVLFSGNVLRDLASGVFLHSPFANGVSNLARSDDLSDSDSASVHKQLFVASPLDRHLSNERKHDILDAVQASRTQAVQDSSTAAVSEAPHGIIVVDSEARTDNSTNRSYYSLFEGPAILSRPKVLHDYDPVSGPRFLANVPNFLNQSVTFAWWHRHNSVEECTNLENIYCGSYIMQAITFDSNASARVCWSFWLEGNGIYFENKEGVYRYHQNFIPSEYALTHSKTWRHISFALDTSDDSITFYLDGQQSWKGPWIGSFAGADCQERSISFGRGFPGWLFGLEIGIYDLRMYVGSVLPPSDILKLARNSGNLSADEICIADSGAVITDKVWKDDVGRSCEWYRENRVHAPAMCTLKGPSTFCPVACSSKQPCFRNPVGEEFVLWDRIRMILPKSKNGSICVNDKMSGLGSAEGGTIGNLQAMCEKWVADGGLKAQNSWSQSFFHAIGQRIDFSNLSSVCNQVITAVDDGCSFNLDTVTNFTAAIKRSGGDFSMGFWIRPLGPKSLTNEKFVPSVVFYSSLFPPTHNIMIGGFNSNPDGEMRGHSVCADRNGAARLKYDNAGFKKLAADQWTFVAWARKNSTTPFESTTITNLGLNMKTSIAQIPMCLYNDTVLFNAIEVNYPVLISPIFMTSEVLPPERLQRRYYSAIRAMQYRRGPLKKTRDRMHKVELERSGFPYKSSLVAPPMIFQKRSGKENCSYVYSRAWILQQALLMSNKCRAPYSCPSTDAPISCLSTTERGNEATFFGLNQSTFKGGDGYGDLLYSIADNAELYRDSSLQPTSNFIDRHTSTLQVHFAFFAPSDGIISVVTIDANLMHASGVDVVYNIQFYEIVEGNILTYYYVLNSLSCILGVLLIVIMWWRVADAVKFQDEINRTQMLTFAMDLINVVLISSGFILGLTTKPQSATLTKDVINTWASISWDSETVPLPSKMDQLFQGIQKVLGIMETNERSNGLMFAVSFFQVLRILQATQFHPRLAILPATLGYATDSLLHAGAVALLNFLGFAIIGVWRFGPVREDFEDINTAALTELTILFSSEYPDDWNKATLEFKIFITLYIFSMVTLILNFILAIIVESYMLVCKDIEDIIIEQNVFKDSFDTLHVYMLKRRWGWPSYVVLGHRLAEMKAKLSVGYEELLNLDLFEDQKTVIAFIDHYKKYEFLIPPRMTKYGAAAQTLEKRDMALIENFSQHLSESLGLQRLTLKDQLKQAEMQTIEKHSSKVKLLDGEEEKGNEEQAKGLKFYGAVELARKQLPWRSRFSLPEQLLSRDRLPPMHTEQEHHSKSHRHDHHTHIHHHHNHVHHHHNGHKLNKTRLERSPAAEGRGELQLPWMNFQPAPLSRGFDSAATGMMRLHEDSQPLAETKALNRGWTDADR